jgi:hypothetical protein
MLYHTVPLLKSWEKAQAAAQRNGGTDSSFVRDNLALGRRRAAHDTRSQTARVQGQASRTIKGGTKVESKETLGPPSLRCVLPNTSNYK